MMENRIDQADVVIAGAGPTGLTLACELGLAGVSAVVIERHAERPGFCRAFNLNARSLELLDRRGLAERFLREGPTVPLAFFGGLEAPLGLADLGFERPYALGIPQTRTEELLEERAAELGVPIRRGHEVIALEQRPGVVIVTVRGPEGEYPLSAGYLVGCDGGRSTVRKRAGIPFPGTEATKFTLLGDVELPGPDALPFGPTRTDRGTVFVIPRPGYARVITADPAPPAKGDRPVTLDELRAAVGRVVGREVGMTNPRWLTRFGDAARQASRYVAGRVILAGDAAHIHPPAGAQGLNVGIQDAFNLGWKLAATVRGWAPPGLLESYHTERHAAGERVLLNTSAQMALGEPGPRCEALRRLFSELARFEPVRRHLAEMVTGVGTTYDMGAGEQGPPLGLLAPNLSLETATGPTTVCELLHPGRGVLLDLADRPDWRAEADGWSDRVDVVTAAARSDSEAAAVGEAVLIRPDGHAAWLAPEGPARLRAALARWFGTPRR